MSVGSEYRKVVDIEAMMRAATPRKRATKRSKHGFNNSWRGMEQTGSTNPNMGVIKGIYGTMRPASVTGKVITEEESARNSNTPHMNNYIIGGH
jgi:hypothetical protein